MGICILRSKPRILFSNQRRQTVGKRRKIIFGSIAGNFPQVLLRKGVQEVLHICIGSLSVNSPRRQRLNELRGEGIYIHKSLLSAAQSYLQLYAWHQIEMKFDCVFLENKNGLGPIFKENLGVKSLYTKFH